MQTGGGEGSFVFADYFVSYCCTFVDTSVLRAGGEIDCDPTLPLQLV